MKRLILSLSVVMFHLTFCAAQQGLHINELFEGHIINPERLIETRVRGKTLEKYQLTYYRSLRFTASNAEEAQIRLIFDKDSKGHHATGSQQAKGNGKHVVNTFSLRVQLSPQAGKNRFLCYQDISKGSNTHEVTVIYMEGTVSDIYQLEEIINKK